MSDRNRSGAVYLPQNVQMLVEQVHEAHYDVPDSVPLYLTIKRAMDNMKNNE